MHKFLLIYCASGFIGRLNICKLIKIVVSIILIWQEAVAASKYNGWRIRMASFGRQKEIYQTAKPKSPPSKPCIWQLYLP